MKHTLKILSLVLALAMLLGSISAFAATEKPLYVALGDSIAEGTGLRNNDVACYGALVAATNGYDFINHAVPGNQTKDLLARLDEETVRNDVAKADIISISIGGNDFLLGGMYRVIADALVCGNYEWMDKIIAEIYVNFSKIVAEIKALNPDALLLVQTLYNPRTDYTREVYETGLQKLNGDFTRYLAEHPGSYVIVDAGAAVKADAHMIAADHIHPNAKGHVAIARVYLKTLKGLGLGTAEQPVIAEEGQNISAMFLLRLIMPLIYTVTSLTSLVKSVFAC